MEAGARDGRLTIGPHATSRPGILVGYDGSDRSDDALDFGQLLASATGGRLTVANVYAFEPFRLRLASGEAAAATLAAGRRRSAPGACDTRMAPALRAAPDARRPLVLGSRHRGRARRGAVGQHLGSRRSSRDLHGRDRSRRAPCRGTAPDRVLTDSSAAGENALPHALTIARRAAGVLRVYESRGLGGGDHPSSMLAARQEPEGRVVHARSAVGDDLARSERDLLVVPSWPRGLLGRLRRRRTRRRGPRQTGCPLLIAPAAARPPAR
jgi:hypothetical protein